MVYFKIACSLLIVHIGLLATAATSWAQVETISAEPELIAILAGDAPAADKAMACKRLAIYGTTAAVPELAKLLSDEQLASWTRIALEAIPGRACDEALRQSCESLEGNLLIGAINSLAVRRDSDSVDTLVALLSNADNSVAAAAAIALGKVGGDTAATALLGLLSSEQQLVRSAAAEGCILCAEQFLALGDDARAIEVYEQVRTAELPKQRIVEATRGAILAQKADGIPLLIEALGSSERTLFQVALQTAREMPSAELAAALVSEVGSSNNGRAPLIVQALADMPGTVELKTIIDLTSGKNSKDVRVAAIMALGRVGDASCVAPLLNVALEAEDLYSTVKASLVEIADESVNQEVVARLPKAQSDTDKQILIEVVGLRRIAATAELVEALDSENSLIRSSALEALGNTVTQDQLELLISQVLKPTHAADASAAQQALKSAASRMPDREACANQIVGALARASAATKPALLEILGAMGGTNALNALGEVAQSNDTQLKDVSSRLLGEWMTIDAAPVLLKLASTGPADKFQVRAMRGYIRIARQFVMDEKTRVEMCSQALRAAKQPAEQLLVLEILERYPTVGTLKLAIQASKTDGLQDEARRVASLIGSKLQDNPQAQSLLRDAGL